MNNSTGPRIPYEKRTNWQAEKHYEYGKNNHLHDIDWPGEMWIEHKSEEVYALVEFKNHSEMIELYKCKHLINLANRAKLPAYICIGYEHLGPAYYIYPLNDLCKNLHPWLAKPRFFSERQYVQFLHFIKGIKADEKTLEGKSKFLPKESETPLPVIVG